MSVSLLLAEGFESALLACSLILLVPGAAVGLTAREAAIPAIAEPITKVITITRSTSTPIIAAASISMATARMARPQRVLRIK